MSDVLARASELGRALRDTPEFRALRDAESAVMASPESVTLAEALGTLHRQRAEAEKSGKPMDPATAARVEAVTGAVAVDPLLQALSRAQQEFQALVHRVNRAMLDELKPPPGGA
ncbi:MAG: YlbF family regulator [Planctomycetaceae bacterium]|nr:YlbF family regulator [Planctomycetota bacterium]NUN53505.1 YlbF family regulator [Planctomycetaceae bacterium]